MVKCIECANLLTNIGETWDKFLETFKPKRGMCREDIIDKFFNTFTPMTDTYSCIETNQPEMHWKDIIIERKCDDYVMSKERPRGRG